MLDSPNILHIILALGGAGCVYAAVLETQQRGIRGARVPLKVDQYRSLIQVCRTTRRALLWVAAVVAADAALVCLAALIGQPVPMARFIGALAAVAACTGMLWARAGAIVVRMQYAPHVDL